MAQVDFYHANQLLPLTDDAIVSKVRFTLQHVYVVFLQGGKADLQILLEMCFSLPQSGVGRDAGMTVSGDSGYGESGCVLFDNEVKVDPSNCHRMSQYHLGFQQHVSSFETKSVSLHQMLECRLLLEDGLSFAASLCWG